MSDTPPGGLPDDTPPGGLPDDTRVGRVALRAADVDSVAAFYRDVVGLRVLDRDATRVTLGAGEPLLELVDAPDAPPRGDANAGLYHAAFRVPSRAALGDALERIRGNWRLEGASDHLVSEALYLTDPEGNGVEVYRDRPRGEWPRTEAGTLRMDTKPLDLDAVAAAADGDGGVPEGTDLGHVHLEVTSVDAAREFYVDALGFDAIQEFRGALFASAGGYHHHVGANTWRGRTAPTAPDSRGLAWFELVLPDDAATAAIRRRLSDRGYSVADADAGFEVCDPDNIPVRVRVES